MKRRRECHTALRLLDALKTHGPQSTDALAERLGASVTTVRPWLAALDEWELVSARPQRNHAYLWDLHPSLARVGAHAVVLASRAAA